MSVNITILICGYEECPIGARIHVQGIVVDDQQWQLEDHFEWEHLPPVLGTVEGGEVRLTWWKFAEWYYFL